MVAMMIIYSFNGCMITTHSVVVMMTTHSYGLESVLTSTITYTSVKTTSTTLYIRKLVLMTDH